MAALALNLAMPELPPLAQDDCDCGLCGQYLQKGVSAAKAYRPPTDFAHEHIHPRRSAWICSSCAAILAEPRMLTQFSRAIYQPHVARRMTTASDVAWMLLAAPAPFLAVYNTRKSAHTIWHAPVTYDKRAIGITWSNHDGTIRLNAVGAAYTALARLSAAYNSTTRAKFGWPVQGLSLRDDLSHYCQLLPSHDMRLRASTDEQIQSDLNAFDKLSLVERWALCAILMTFSSPRLAWDELPAHIDHPPPLLLLQKGDAS